VAVFKQPKRLVEELIEGFGIRLEGLSGILKV
jgi:hypothetical protein